MNPSIIDSCIYEGAGLWSFFCTEKDQIASLASIISALTAIIGAWLAVTNLKAIRRDSEAQTRPYIYVSLALGVQLNGSVDLVVENQGKTPAQNLRFSLEDPSSTKPNEYSEIKPYDYIWPRLEKVMFSNAFYLPPQGKIRWMWASIDINTGDKSLQRLDEKKR